MSPCPKWHDLLTSYDGEAITYDGVGNPLTYGSNTYTWKHGRQLASLSDGTTTWSYTYNADGLRTARTNGTTTYGYVYSGSSLAQMTAGTDTLYFAYDANGTPMALTLNGTDYYYVTNLQGDVIAILNDSGTAVVTYTYDAWGKLLSTDGTMATTLGTLNPLRYRGYVYDVETGLYYVSSRYYDPEIGRWINADGQISSVGGELLGYNQFVYCFNNPVNMSDDSGNWPSWNTVFKAAATVLAVTAVAVAVVATVGAIGVAAGVVTTAIVHSAAIGAAVGGVVAGTTNAFVQSITKSEENIDYKEIATNTAIGSTTGAISSAAGAIVPTAPSGTTALIAQKGCQIAINTTISVGTYVLTTPEPTVQGFAVAFSSGIVSGSTFNEPFFRSLVYSVGLELSGYVDEVIKFFDD